MVSTHVAADAVVLGSGTAGLNAAVQLARIGLDVALVEQRALGKGGARWVNGVVPSQFERAGLDLPDAPELRESGGTAHFLSPDGRHGYSVMGLPTLGVDMRLLNERLLAEAAARGVRLFERAEGVRGTFADGRLAAIEVLTGPVGGEPVAHRFDAALFVDATGLAATLRRQSAALSRWCPDPGPDQLCSASQFTYRIADPDGARRFLESHGARPGDTVDWLGFAGGFSALAIRVEESLDEVGVLTGTLGAGEWGSGRSILRLTRARHPWIGDVVFGGSGLIPLRRPYDRFTAAGLALVGDAACQVFPAHGSGIGIGLIAGTMLAEAVARDGSIRADDDGDPGSEQTLWDYQASFMREFGGVLAGYDAIRRMSSSLGTAGIRRMYRAGVLSAESTRAGLEQVWDPPRGAQLGRQALSLARDPALALRVIPHLARAASAGACYSRYPDVADERSLRRWSRATSLALGA